VTNVCANSQSSIFYFELCYFELCSLLGFPFIGPLVVTLVANECAN
jgi:hypothetical protein